MAYVDNRPRTKRYWEDGSHDDINDNPTLVRSRYRTFDPNQPDLTGTTNFAHLPKRLITIKDNLAAKKHKK
jgi:hypothetical protein